MSKLYFGDNFEVLRSSIEPRSVDLIYLDPPFNSKAQYNVLFESPRGETSAQAGAFLDTWTWGEEAEWSYREIMKGGGGVARYIDALHSALGHSDMMAYLVMMAIRLTALSHTLKPTGSLYLHCDPTASHYLKVILDAIFGPQNFRSEVIWKRTSSHNSAKRWGPIHDTILFVSKSDSFVWNKVPVPYDEKYVKKFYKYKDATGRVYRLSDLTGSGVRHGESGKAWGGFDPTDHGRHWAIPSVVKEEFPDESDDEKSSLDWLNLFDRDGLVEMTGEGAGWPHVRRYFDRMPGQAVQDIVLDIPPLSKRHAERIGYPTQKPLALLDRIIRSSSNEGDTVLDPFCGCGTTIEAAERAGRQWIGIDVAIHAIKVIQVRLEERLGKVEKNDYSVEGIPRDFQSAKRLAELNPYQFQWWANYLFNPHALREQKRGADRGIDGELYFPNGPGRPWGRMLTSVKSGENVGPAMVREFGRVLDREKAELGLFICLNRPTRDMTTDAADMGFGNTVHGEIPRLQIVAIEDWFKGKLPKLPPLEHLPSAAFSTAKRRAASATHVPANPDQPELPLLFVSGSKNSPVHFNPQMVSRSPEKEAAA
jgi:site-specific DNA-methyltransferase (adenine-specific)